MGDVVNPCHKSLEQSFLTVGDGKIEIDMLQTGGFPPLVLLFWQVVDAAPCEGVFALNVLGWGRVGMCQLLARSSWTPVGVL